MSIRKLTTGLTLMVIGIVIFGQNAGAISRTYFDPTDSSAAGSSVWVMAGETQYNYIGRTEVKLYFPSRTGASITIYDFNYCGLAGQDDLEGGYYANNISSLSGPITQFSIGGTARGNGHYKSSNCVGNTAVYDIPPEKLTYDATVGYYVTTFLAQHINKYAGACNDTSTTGCDGIQNYFRLVASPGGLISHVQGSTGYGTTMIADDSRSTVYTDFNIKFGSDCSISGPVRKWIYLYDLDNRVPGIQPESLNFTLLKSVGYGAWTTVSLVSTPPGWIMNNGYYAPPSGQSSTSEGISFIAEPDARYQLRINHVYGNNLIQFSVPFDGIYYNQPCNGSPNLGTSVSISPNTAGIGDTVTSKLSFKNNGKSTINNASYWYEMVAYNGGNRVASLARPGTTTRWNTGVLAPGQVFPPDDRLNWSLDWTDIIRNGTRDMAGTVDELIYKTDKVCVQIWSSQITLTPAGSVSPNLSQSCTTIAKTPALTVRGGDLRVGGSFASSSATTCRIPISLTNNKIPYGVLGYEDYERSRSSLGEYATYTPGSIYGYGSGGLPYNSGGNMWRYLLFGTQGFVGTWGNGAHSSNLAEYSENGLFLGTSGVTTGTTSYCLANLANVYPSGPRANIEGGTDRYNSSPKTDINYHFTGQNSTLYLSSHTAAGIQFNPGERAVIKVTQARTGNANNKIVIRGPIRYAQSGYTSIAQLPQFVLIADGKIDIQFDGAPGIPSFEINGLYSTGGNIYTCDNQKGDAGLTWSGRCSTPFIAKGAVIAGGRVLPFRTAGFDKRTDTSTYAEEFNLTPETLLSDYSRTAGSSNLSVDYVTEMPARY